MSKLNIEIPRYSFESDPERERRIAELLHGAAIEQEEAERWYRHLKEHLRFPFRAQMITPDSTATVMRAIQVRLTRLAEPERCGYRQIWMVGYPFIREDIPYYFFLNDLYKLEAEESVIRVVLDYLYWCKK